MTKSDFGEQVSVEVQHMTILAKTQRIYTKDGLKNFVILEYSNQFVMLEDTFCREDDNILEIFKSETKHKSLRKAMLKSDYQKLIEYLARKELRPRQFRGLKQEVQVQ